MIEVLATVCLLSVPLDIHPKDLLDHPVHGTKCKEVRKVYFEETANLTPHQCLLNGQKYVIKWLAKNPGWRLRLIRCAPKKGLYALEQRA